MKYSEPGSAVTIGRVSTSKGNAVYVQDSGIGFDMGYEPKIWMLFERLVLDTEYQGTGIGLHTVAQMVERMAGEVWAESSLGNGSRFFFTLGEKPEPAGALNPAA